MMFTPEQVKAAIDALAGGDGAAALEILQALLTAAASGGEAGAEGAPPAAAGATAGNADVPPEMQALARGVIELFGGDAGSALVAVKALKSDADKRANDSKVLEGAERRTLVGALVELGVESPGTAWEDPDAGDTKVVPVERLAKEDLAGLRKRVAIMRSVRGKAGGKGTPAERHTPPAGGEADESALTDVENKHAADITDPEARKRYVARRLARRSK